MKQFIQLTIIAFTVSISLFASFASAASLDQIANEALKRRNPWNSVTGHNEVRVHYKVTQLQTPGTYSVDIVTINKNIDILYSTNNKPLEGWFGNKWNEIVDCKRKQMRQTNSFSLTVDGLNNSNFNPEWYDASETAPDYPSGIVYRALCGVQR
ncbi:hypothetical protein [Geobacter benzoatilyticus]|uniref:Uncharacterized protein n=1 Tax=Geobacter benzoatilyticus TaxID=2815309 RepID=A0ABX7Q374_9BACT|nr:hypothetical protein [Geobacter benzoatilyticus]QSV45896.1 hypothetical protein JZM60_00950 [Geobacter benzoatilyticus]